MRLLLDTHALLWFCKGSDSLSPKARAALEDERNERWVSHATAWEVAIKMSLGKLKLPMLYEELFPGVVTRNGWRMLPPELQYYYELLKLPWHHRDPFDRLLTAQAQMEGLTVVTCDPHFPSYNVPLLW